MRRPAALLLLLAVGACGSTPIDLSGNWPSRPGNYEQVARAWTRHDQIVRDYDKILDVWATFLSPEWRAADVDRQIKAERLPEDEAKALRDAQTEAAAGDWEVELLVSTYNYRENDLQKGDKSMWRIALVDEQGRQVRPKEIRVDHRPGSLLGAYFPWWTPFYRAYVVRFPRSAAVLHDGAKKFSLLMGSAHGSIELTWHDGAQ